MTDPALPPADDPVAIAAALVRCESVTPAEGGALALLEPLLSGAGFACTRVDRGGVANLFARFGPKGHPRSFGFNGHTDVVPPGDAAAWRAPPFAGLLADGRLWGRGAADMKSGVAAFAAAAIARVRAAPPAGAILIALTGDEEGRAEDGTRALLDWMAETGERMTVCLVGEPTCPERLGDTIKIGRRGAMTVHVTATGRQGHAAYPERARNPVAALARLVARLDALALDSGSAHFGPSTLAATGFDTANPAANVIPRTCRAMVNIRFSDLQTPAGIVARLEAEAAAVTAATGVAFDFAAEVSGRAFLTPPGPFVDLVAGAVRAETGIAPALSTSGGTSDARFMAGHCPVLEFGLVGATMHQTDESVAVDDIRGLARVYRRILDDFFAGWKPGAGGQGSGPDPRISGAGRSGPPDQGLVVSARRHPPSGPHP